MNALDQIIADALAGSPETHVAILAREVVRLREAPAVVVPDFSDAKAGVLAWENGYDDGDHLARDLVKAAWAYARSNSSTIPAPRANQGGADHV